ncbi:MAG: carboxypeptidase-like regulatory domain-containing protein [Patescibacteria group bacterium]
MFISLRKYFKKTILSVSFLAVVFFVCFPATVFSVEPVYHNFSLTYPIGELQPSEGDIIVRNRYKNTFRISSIEDSADVFGVVASDAALVFRTEEPDSVPIMRFGQTAVNVILKNGDIERGDNITTSEVIGHGQAVQPYHRYTLGVALEGLSEEDASEEVVGPDGETYPSGQVVVDLRISFHGSGVINISLQDIPSQAEPLEVGAMFRQNFQTMRQLGEEVTDQARDILETEAGSIASRFIETGGAVTGAMISFGALFLSPVTVFEVFALPFRIWALFLALFGIKRRSRPWGVVYDSVTKQPIDPAYVILEDDKGNEVKMSITDIDGRYGFLVDPGKYKMKANKTNYIFPSEKLKGRRSDVIHNNLYFGETFEVNKKNAVIDKNIPMDPQDFDWNEFTKLNKKILTYYSYADLFKAFIFQWLFYAGFIVSLVSVFLVPDTYSYVILGVYLFLFFLRIVGLKPRRYGKVVEEETNTPLSYAIVHICLKRSGREVSTSVCDAYGRYFALASNGEYYVKIDKKKGEEDYENVFTSEPFEVKGGVIKRTFKV